MARGVNGIWPEVTSSPEPDDADHLGADALDGDVERLEDARSETLLLAQQAEEDVLGTDVVVLEDAGLLLGEDDHLPGPFGEALKHAAALLSVGNYGAGVTRSFPTRSASTPIA